VRIVTRAAARPVHSGDVRPQPDPAAEGASQVPPSVVRVTPPATRDAQRARVYRAEDAWAARLDAARRGAALATVAGSAVLLPGERRLGSLQAAADYAARVVALPEVVAVFGPVPPPGLRPRRGVRMAHWEPPGTIALPVPEHGEPWALRETVLLHELAHHLTETTGRARGHRPPYPAAVLLLARVVLGEEAALVLRIEYGEHDVEVGVL
jgi:putative metallohydrolase (TIGR04338 family)